MNIFGNIRSHMFGEEIIYRRMDLFPERCGVAVRGGAAEHHSYDCRSGKSVYRLTVNEEYRVYGIIVVLTSKLVCTFCNGIDSQDRQQCITAATIQ